MVNAREDVEQRTRGRSREPDPAGCDDRHAECRGQRGERFVVGLFIAPEMTLQLDVRAVPAEQADHAIEQAAHAIPLTVERRAADEGDQSAGIPVKLLQRQRPFTLRRAELHPSDQAAEITVALLRLTEDR